ncbi:MFS transporter [Aeromicrobium panaciterrae]|uniref:MFS transporter n=1 Tax=Aeromicrobium panaciterrae TaxID=363861 RepID=UPI0031D60BDA
MSLRTRFLLLTGLRWLPTGFIIPVTALLPLHRGLTIAEMGAAFALQGVVVLLLELPTGGFADALGRKPVIMASSCMALLAYVVFVHAQSVLAFAIAASLTGVFRALDSGPLNAWFVDATHAQGGESADVVRGLSGSAGVIGAAIATGSLAAGGLIAWAPVDDTARLTSPYWIAIALTVVQLIAVTVLMDEDRSARVAGVLASITSTPRVVASSFALVRRSRVLAALVAVELFWGFGMVAFESLMPVRMSELLGDRDDAAAVMGPIVAAGWGLSAVGAFAVPLLLRRWSMRSVSFTLRIVQGVTVVGMGLAAGPIGLVVAYFATYGVHIVAGAIYESQLHEQVGPEQRATVLSLASMAMHPAASVGSIVLGAIATGASTATAMVVGGVMLALAAPLFLVRPAAEDPDVRRPAYRGSAR